MADLKIEILGSPVLRQRAEDVTEVDDDLRMLISDMFDAMYEAEGIGLAGPQVGVSKRVLVVDLKEGDDQRTALINPRIVQHSDIREKAEEGCLSIPGVSAHVDRAVDVVIEGIDETGAKVRIEAEGLYARCLQHEIDHLDGILFIDHLSPLKRSMLLKKYRSQLEEDKAGPARKTTSHRGG